MKRTVVREGSVASKFIKVCDWLDNSKPGGVISVAIVGLLFFGLAVYGLQCTHTVL